MNAISGFTDAICEVLIINGSSLTTLNGSSNLWNKSTLDEGNAWLHTSDDDLQRKISHLDTTADLTDFMGTLPSYKISLWSMDLITELQSKIATHWDQDHSGYWSGEVSSESSLIQSTSGQETSTGDAENKACQSALQNASSAGQPASNAGDSVLGVLSNGSSVQAQISA